MKKINILILISFVFFAFYCKKQEEQKPVEQKVETGVKIVEPQDGSEVTSPVKVKLEVVGKTLAKAGEAKENEGHFHILINGEDFVEAGTHLHKKDEMNLVLDQGESEAELNLKPGEYTITAQLASGDHKSLGKDWAKKIKIKVVEKK